MIYCSLCLTEHKTSDTIHFVDMDGVLNILCNEQEECAKRFEGEETQADVVLSAELLLALG